MAVMTRSQDMELRIVVKHYVVTLTSEGFAPTTIATNQSVLKSFLAHAEIGDADIYVMDADGSNVRQLTNNPAPDWSPAWSPDGTRIAFARLRDGYFDGLRHGRGWRQRPAADG